MSYRVGDENLLYELDSSQANKDLDLSEIQLASVAHEDAPAQTLPDELFDEPSERSHQFHLLQDPNASVPPPTLNFDEFFNESSQIPYLWTNQYFSGRELEGSSYSYNNIPTFDYTDKPSSIIPQETVSYFPSYQANEGVEILSPKSRYPDLHSVNPVQYQPYPIVGSDSQTFGEGQAEEVMSSSHFANYGGYLGSAHQSEISAGPSSDFQAQSSTASPKPEVSYKKYRAEKPKLDQQHSWVRLNRKTAGKSTRTGKINSYDPRLHGGYTDTPHPCGNWNTLSNLQFRYTEHGELEERTFTPAGMKEFLWQHPLAKGNPSGLLTLWIQMSPADSGRRYPTFTSNKCRFEDCPERFWSRSIDVGSYRVAIDEQWETHADKRDPFLVAAYVHLYCLERFCDMRDICRNFNVRADHRAYMAREPKNKFHPALSQSAYQTAIHFIQSCRKGDLERNFLGYPAHDDRNPTNEKWHEATLTCALTDDHISNLSPSKVSMMRARGLTESNILVHRGNLQMSCNARVQKKTQRQNAARDARPAYLSPPNASPYEGYVQVVHPAPVDNKRKRPIVISSDDDDESALAGHGGSRAKRRRSPHEVTAQANLTNDISFEQGEIPVDPALLSLVDPNKTQDNSLLFY